MSTDLKIRVWVDEVLKDVTALEMYANPDNWRKRKSGRWEWIGPGDGPLVAENALHTAPRSLIAHRGRRRISRTLTAPR